MWKTRLKTLEISYGDSNNFKVVVGDEPPEASDNKVIWIKVFNDEEPETVDAL